jgi:hypothetical protein
MAARDSRGSPRTQGGFALFYVLAQALERLFEVLQLLWPTLGSTTAGNQSVSKQDALRRRDATLAETINVPSNRTAEAAAGAHEAVDRIRLNRSFLAWTITSAVAMVASGYLGLGLMSTIAENATRVRVLDVIITGLVVGGGTKPLHDLIANLQESRKKKEDQPAT